MSGQMTDAERKIRRYLARSSGNCGYPTDGAIRAFLRMVEAGEADMQTFRRLAGDEVVSRMNRMAVELSEVIQ